MQLGREISTAGAFVRQQSEFRGRDVEPVPGRYRLYVSLACPWAHRTIIVRALKGLEEAIPMTIVDPLRDAQGWRFAPGLPDPERGAEYLAALYHLTNPAFDGRVTVPVLWDREEGRIVNNESADIIELLATEFDAHARHPEVDLWPEDLREPMAELNAFVYDRVNDGVYKAGFARTQEAYEDAVIPLFEALETLDERLADERFLMGTASPTLADVRLFTTLVRFDAVYVGHFKCNIRRIADHAHLGGYLRDMYQWPGIGETVNFDHIKRHYYMTHEQLNPSGIVPVGPALDLDAPHGRDRL